MAACSGFQSVFCECIPVSCVSVTVTNWQAWWRLSTTTPRLVCWNSHHHHHLHPPRTYLLIYGIVAQNLKGSQSSNHLHQYLRKNIKFLSTARFTWREPQINVCKSYNYLLPKQDFLWSVTADVMWWNNVYEQGALCWPVSPGRGKPTSQHLL